MFKILSHTPIYAWFFLAYLLWGGWKARKTYVVSWKALLVMPVIMFAWSIYSILTHYGAIYILLWMLSMSLGIWLGTLDVRRLNLKFDKQQKLIEITGNWTPILLSVSIFAFRYFLGVSYGLHPELRGNLFLLGIENGATIISGMLAGRLVGFWRQSRNSQHVDLGVSKSN